MTTSYSEFDQILCAAGFIVVSPAVRGSTGFGRDFHALNDKDLGGDEIVDLFHVARWLETRTGLSARRIGVYGGSHGGYATMRAMTFPPETNGTKRAAIAFGFGMSHAGFSRHRVVPRCVQHPRLGACSRAVIRSGRRISRR